MDYQDKNKDPHNMLNQRRYACLAQTNLPVSEAETQQIGVRRPLYCVRHPDRDLGRLRRIQHLHLGAQAMGIAATFTLDSGLGIPSARRPSKGRVPWH